MKNIAIIIGIAEYDNANKLVACNNDAKIIKDIITASKKYDEILYFQGKSDNNKIIEELENVKVKLSNEEIGEIFFYFSGHGYVNENDLFFVTTNTDIDRINSTSLKNTEIDSLFRGLNPNIYVKVIDACHSGIRYVKGMEDDILSKKKLNESKNEFNKCYFMFSSLKSQYSYTMEDNTMSFFTKSFVDALKYYMNNAQIKYSEISNYISDNFENSDLQTPFFITQADMTDKFIEYNSEVINILKQNNVAINKSEGDVQKQLEERLKLCATKEEALKIVNNIVNEFKLLEIKDKIIQDFFDESKIIDNKINDIPNKKEIANWIYTNKKKLGLFAKTKLEELPKILQISQSISESLYGTENGERYEFEITENSFSTTMQMALVPKNLGLRKYEMNIIIVPSFIKLYIFYSFNINNPITWGEYEYGNSTEWNMKEILIKDKNIDIKKCVENFYNEFYNYCMNNLKDMLE